MIKKLTALFLFTLLLASPSLGQADSLFNRGVEMLSTKKYSEAQQFFEQTISEKPSFAGYYNLGIAFSHQEKWLKSLWAYESALKFQPNDGTAQYNAQLAFSKLDKEGEWEHPFSWLERIILSVGLFNWILLACIFSLISAALIFVVTAKVSNNFIRTWSNRLIIPCFILLGGSIYFGTGVTSHFNKLHFFYTEDEKTSVYIKPNSVKLDETLSPGKRYKIHKSYDGWLQIETESGKPGWIKEEKVLSY